MLEFLGNFGSVYGDWFNWFFSHMFYDYCCSGCNFPNRSTRWSWFFHLFDELCQGHLWLSASPVHPVEIFEFFWGIDYTYNRRSTCHSRVFQILCTNSIWCVVEATFYFCLVVSIITRILIVSRVLKSAPFALDFPPHWAKFTFVLFAKRSGMISPIFCTIQMLLLSFNVCVEGEEEK